MTHPDAFAPLQRNVRPLDQLIVHPNLEKPLRMLCATNLCMAPGSLIYVVGAGGAGKTSLLRAFMQNCFGDASRWPSNVIPYAYAEAINSDRTYFSASALATDLLVALGDPFARESISKSQSERAEAIERAYRSVGKAPRTVQETFEAVEGLGRRSQLRYLIVDEGNLLVMVQRNHVASDFVEFLRRLADRIECVLIIAGTFELIDVMDFSAQINRRATNIHLKRLEIDTADRASIFAGMAQGLGADFGMEGATILKHLKWLHEVSYGLPGELDGLFRRARVEGLVNERETPNWDDVVSAQQAPRLQRRMRIEADIVDAAFAGEMTPRQVGYLRKARTAPIGRRAAKRHVAVHA